MYNPTTPYKTGQNPTHFGESVRKWAKLAGANHTVQNRTLFRESVPKSQKVYAPTNTAETTAQNLPKPTKTYQNLPKPTKTSHIPHKCAGSTNSFPGVKIAPNRTKPAKTCHIYA